MAIEGLTTIRSIQAGNDDEPGAGRTKGQQHDHPSPPRQQALRPLFIEFDFATYRSSTPQEIAMRDVRHQQKRLSSERDDETPWDSNCRMTNTNRSTAGISLRKPTPMKVARLNDRVLMLSNEVQDLQLQSTAEPDYVPELAGVIPSGG